jgi:hypothetical protein
MTDAGASTLSDSRGGEQARAVRLALQTTQVSMGSECEYGVLTFADDRLVAIFTRLDASFYDKAQGCWNLELGFGRCAAAPAPFEDLSEALHWVCERLSVVAQNMDEVLADVDERLSLATAGGTGARRRR